MARADFPTFYPIVDASACRAAGLGPLDVAHACLRGGARVLQLRVKDDPDSEFLRLADLVVRAARNAGATVFINDRADIALMSGADGVHVGQDDLPPAAVRRFAPRLRIGVSTHTPAQIAAAAGEPVDYLAIGPVFATHTKATGYDAVGLESVALAAARAGGLPVVAIGGITLETAAQVLDAGAASVAVISDLLAGHVESRVRAFVNAVGRS